MNEQEKLFFSALQNDRADSAAALEKPSMRGIKNSVVEKYSDQAHFIYELLQNADDAHATTARFVLEENRLIFAHNGSRHFSVTDPANEEADSENNTLGDINAITSIANSNKTEASIGKFGVGFKAVFQYTQTPHIYDPIFRFKIERFIVPILLDEDFPLRHSDETLFVFPFDHKERNANEAYSDISDKLKNLSFPLLFLTNLKDIEFEFNDVLGLYEKNIKETIKFDDTIAEHIVLTQNSGDEIYDENLWLFSRMDEHRHRYSVGFFTDKDGFLKPVDEPAFCFFPTKEVTNLSFIIHAPFLLTDSREGIRAGEFHNDNMISKLADLSAASLEYLRDIGVKESMRLINDRIIDIIPVDEKAFSDPSDKRKVSFLPFYKSIKEKFETTELVPTENGYVLPKNAYWAAVPQLTQLFSNAQLSEIVDNPDAQWAFLSIGRDSTRDSSNKSLLEFIDSLVKTNINEDAIINGRTKGSYYDPKIREMKYLENVKGITAHFIELQPITWLHKFYEWLFATKHRTEIAKRKPIFLNQDGKAIAAFDKDGQRILFLPAKNITGYSVVHSDLLKNKDTYSFIKEIGVQTPSKRDYIYNKILPLYKKGEEKDATTHFKLFFDYYCEKCMNGEDEEFIGLIKGYEFLIFYSVGSTQPHYGKASSMYLPTKELREYFETKRGVRFIDIEKYKQLVGSTKEKQLISFLSELGIKKEIEIITVDVDESTRNDLPNSTKGKRKKWKETIILGCKEIVDYISTNNDFSKSVLLWNCLLSIIKSRCSRHDHLSELIKGTYQYFYYSNHTEPFPSSDELYLKQKAWLINSDGEFVNAENLTIESLSNDYDTSSNEAKDLLEFLGINNSAVDEDYSNLTETQRKKLEFADKVIAKGMSEDDLEDFVEFKRQKEARKNSTENTPNNDSNNLHRSSSSNATEDIDNLFDEDENSTDSSKDKNKIKKATSNVIKDIAKRTKEKETPSLSHEIADEYDYDEDEYMPSPVDYSKKIERAKQKSAAEIDRITYFEELQNKALSAPKYSYGWFKTLLEMESINSGEANSHSREVSISFAKAEREPGTKRTLVLKHPDKYIPQFMEELADIPLVLHMGDQSKKVAVEVANIKSYTLRVKLKSAELISDIDFSAVTSATIDAKSPAFLLEELRKQFAEFEFEDDFNMQENLCENIEFVFGPPGTGKTTHLAKNILLPIMKNAKECKVLVLTPTNKSADVLVKRLMEVSESDTSYNDWLVRFGATGDEGIEQSPVFRDKTFDIRKLSKSVTVTTIARFPYDFFMPEGARVFLNGINWDYIIIDEASMIPLANIVYPLYKKTPQKFIIAGDPFQIEPITSIDLWKNENIYTMVHLDAFENPDTTPYQYKVDLLTTQYRSIPDIGRIFSEFAYGGILKHYRDSNSQRSLNLRQDFGIKTLNIIKFPVSKYESIYRCKRLQHSSSYQVYSAIFTFEYVSYLSRAIAKNNKGSMFKIGIIAPYRAQADMIDKLLSSEQLPDEVDVQVGTIHGFQGDECDIIFAVFNTPPSITASKEMFLNKKNIINVSISRARDYLFVVMPDDETDNINNLHLVKRVEGLIKSSDSWNEFASPNLEELIFGDSKYLENNTFSTGHQSVNVYGLPEKKYEVRTEETAVDVQIHRMTGQVNPAPQSSIEKSTAS